MTLIIVFLLVLWIVLPIALTHRWETELQKCLLDDECVDQLILRTLDNLHTDSTTTPDPPKTTDPPTTLDPPNTTDPPTTLDLPNTTDPPTTPDLPNTTDPPSTTTDPTATNPPSTTVKTITEKTTIPSCSPKACDSKCKLGCDSKKPTEPVITTKKPTEPVKLTCSPTACDNICTLGCKPTANTTKKPTANTTTTRKPVGPEVKCRPTDCNKWCKLGC